MMSENLPFVSIVIPTYNRASRIHNSLDSLISQDYPKDKYEIIMVDDGSTDETKEILINYSKLAECGFMWFTQENKGIASATNTGLIHARGEIILFTGDDCIAKEDWIHKLIIAFKDDCIGGVGGIVIARKLETIVQTYIEERGILSQEKFNSNNFIITGNAAYRKDALEKIKWLDENLNACIDVDLSIRVQLAGYNLSRSNEAIISHDHPPDVYHLYKQQFRNGIGFSRLHKKYKKDFDITYNLIILTYRIIMISISYPLRFFSAILHPDKKKKLAYPLLDLVVISSNLIGIVRESLFGQKYSGVKIEGKIPFIEEQSLTSLLKKLKTKISKE